MGTLCSSWFQSLRRDISPAISSHPFLLTLWPGMRRPLRSRRSIASAYIRLGHLSEYLERCYQKSTLTLACRDCKFIGLKQSINVRLRVWTKEEKGSANAPLACHDRSSHTLIRRGQTMRYVTGCATCIERTLRADGPIVHAVSTP